MTLKELRAKWEKGHREILCVPCEPYTPSDGKPPVVYSAVYVVTFKDSGSIYRNSYNVFRYFLSNGEWEVSIDMTDQDHLEVCLEYITNSLKEFYPEH